jgi:hypothetical protein
METEKLIPCHTCGTLVDRVWSVRLQRLPGYRIVTVVYAGRSRKEIVDLVDRRWTGPNDPEYQQYRAASAWRREFVCEACYTALDNLDSVAEIVRQGITSVWQMSLPSSRGKAAVHDCKSWRRYQQRRAAEMRLG